MKLLGDGDDDEFFLGGPFRPARRTGNAVMAARRG